MSRYLTRALPFAAALFLQVWTPLALANAGASSQIAGIIALFSRSGPLTVSDDFGPETSQTLADPGAPTALASASSQGFHTPFGDGSVAVLSQAFANTTPIGVAGSRARRNAWLDVTNNGDTSVGFSLDLLFTYVLDATADTANDSAAAFASIDFLIDGVSQANQISVLAVSTEHLEQSLTQVFLNDLSIGGHSTRRYEISVAARAGARSVPEPTTLLLMIGGIGGLVLPRIGRRRRM